MGDDKIKTKGTPVSNETSENAHRLFGEMMRSAREVTGISQAQLSETTRITPEFVAALEEGNFSKLPGAVFGRGFVRSICKALGTDSKDYVAAFDEAVRSAGGEVKNGNLKVATTEGVSNVRLRSESGRERGVLSAAAPSWKTISRLPYGTIIGVCLIAIAIPTFLWLVGRPSQTATSSSSAISSAQNELRTPSKEFVPESASQAASTEASAPEVKANVIPSTAEEKTAAITPVQEPTELKVQAEQGTSSNQRLEVTVKEALKLKINLDNGAWDTKNLEPGNYTYEFTENAQLLVFDASAVDIKFNGRALGNLGTKGRVRRLSFAAKRPVGELNRDQKL